MWKKARAIQKQNISPHVLSRGGYEFLENKLMEEKKKKQLEEAVKSGSHWSSISHQTTCEVEDGPHQENWANDFWGG